MTRVARLSDAIEAHVKPEMHLHFASTPSRSNAGIRELARRFRGTSPKFVLSATGFHSMAHLLVRLRLARTYIACFFGDNYPIPRPNPLYQTLADERAVQLQVWSLLSYVEAFRAGALGKRFEVTRSLAGTDLGRDLAKTGCFVEVEMPGAGTLGLVKAMRADIAFVHAPLADTEGNVVVSGPSCEGFWAASGATRGVIVTVEKVVPAGSLREFRDSMPIPRHKVLAICHEPQGAHPQPLFVEPRFGVEGYADDFEQYRLWRTLATDDAVFARFEELVLDASDGRTGYEAFRTAFSQRKDDSTTPPSAREFPRGTEIMLVLGARTICERVKAKGYKIIIAGIGSAFFAARLAKIWLGEQGIDVDIIVETGMVGIPCGPEGDDYILGYKNMAHSGRISDVEDALGLLTCGADSACLGVVGAAQIDFTGAINSSIVDGKLLVGPGGANDIASCAAEVIALSRCEPTRIVAKVDYVTSPGDRVTRVVTDVGTFSRDSAGGSWSLAHAFPAWGGAPLSEALGRIKALCPWSYSHEGLTTYAQAISTKEMMTIHSLRGSNELWTRERR